VLIDVESTLTMGEPLVGLVFRSDRTHHSNFAGDKKQWPVYTTIDKLSSMICLTPYMHSMVMVTLLLIPTKNRNIPQKWLDEQWQQTKRCKTKYCSGYSSHSPLNIIV